MSEQQVVDEIRTELDGRPVGTRRAEPGELFGDRNTGVPGAASELLDRLEIIDRSREVTARAALHTALAAAQADMPAVEKDSVNPHFRSKFVSLDHLIAKTRPVLNRHGLSIDQFPVRANDGMPVLRTTIRHKDGGLIEGEMPLLPGKQDMQGLGAAISYARRFSWAAACGIASETDDDGESIADHNQAAGQNTPQEARGSAQTASGGSDGPAPAGNGRTPPAASKQQLGFINGLMGELAEAGVAEKDDLVGYARKEYGVAELENLTGGRNGQASELISRLQVRLAGHLLDALGEEAGSALLFETCGTGDISAVEAGALAGLIAAAKKAGQA